LGALFVNKILLEALSFREEVIDVEREVPLKKTDLT